jgi:hypothetical protein
MPTNDDALDGDPPSFSPATPLNKMEDQHQPATKISNDHYSDCRTPLRMMTERTWSSHDTNSPSDRFKIDQHSMT